MIRQSLMVLMCVALPLTALAQKESTPAERAATSDLNRTAEGGLNLPPAVLNGTRPAADFYAQQDSQDAAYADRQRHYTEQLESYDAERARYEAELDRYNREIERLRAQQTSPD